MNRRHEFCPDCGAELPDGEFPLSCQDCDATHFLNPTPVAVLVQPIGDGVLTVRRDIPPHRGELALPGGFIDVDEAWQAAAVRELREETGIEADASQVEVFDVKSAPDGTVLIFGKAPPLSASATDDFSPTDEVDELVVVNKPRELAFSLHTEVIAEALSR